MTFYSPPASHFMASILQQLRPDDHQHVDAPAATATRDPLAIAAVLAERLTEIGRAHV